MEGIIIKGIGGFYYVQTEEKVVQSRARGNFREEGIVPLVGDRVRIRISKEDGNGYIDEIFPRKSSLLRPNVANVDQVIIVMSVKEPEINNWLLDKFILLGEKENLEILIVINKIDLDKKKAKEIENIYRKIGYRVILNSNLDPKVEEIRESFKGKLNVLAGPSGVGKSTLLNKIDPKLKLETSQVSKKTKRGRHTTRHTELISIDDKSFVLDTPGFSSLKLDFIEDEHKIQDYFLEMKKSSVDCAFVSCLHLEEPNCQVKKDVEEGLISRDRYKNYISFIEEFRKTRRY